MLYVSTVCCDAKHITLNKPQINLWAGSLEHLLWFGRVQDASPESSQVRPWACGKAEVPWCSKQMLQWKHSNHVCLSSEDMDKNFQRFCHSNTLILEKKQ